MNRIRYILDLSGVRAPEGFTNYINARRFDEAAGKKTGEKKKKSRLKAALITAAAIIAAGAAILFSVLISRGGSPEVTDTVVETEPAVPEEQPLIDLMYVMYTDERYAPFRFAASYACFAGAEAVIADSRLSACEKLFGAPADLTAPALFKRGTRVIGSGTAALYGRTDVLEAGTRSEELPDGFQTLIIGAYDEGTFRYLLTITLEAKETKDEMGFDLYSSDGKKVGRMHLAGYGSPIPMVSLLSGSEFDYVSCASVFKTRIENGVPVIYEKYGVSAVEREYGDDSFVTSFYLHVPDAGRSFVFRNVCTDELTSDPLNSYAPVYGDVITDGHTYTFDHCPDGWDPFMISLIEERLSADWFIPMFSIGDSVEGTTYIGIPVYATDGSRFCFGDSGGPNDDYPAGLRYASGAADVPFLDDSVFRVDFFTAIRFTDNSGCLIRNLNAETLGKALADRFTAFDGGGETYSYPALVRNNGAYPVTPFSAGLLQMTPYTVPDGDSTLFSALGCAAAAPEKITVTDFSGEKMLSGLILCKKNVTVTSVGKPRSFKGATGDFKAVEVKGYENAGSLIADLSGVICGVISEDGVRYFEGAKPCDTLTVVTDGGGSAVYCTFSGSLTDGFAGIYPFERLDCGLYYDAAGYYLSKSLYLGEYYVITGLREGEDQKITTEGYYPGVSTALYAGYRDGGAFITVSENGVVYTREKGILNAKLPENVYLTEMSFHVKESHIDMRED